MLDRSCRLFVPPVQLLRRRLSGRWWAERGTETEQPMPDSAAGPGRQTFQDGVGKVISRRYTLPIRTEEWSAERLMTAFCENPNAFSPTSYAAFSGPLVLGDKVTVHLAGPWDGPVQVDSRSATEVVLGTLDGHMEAGWIRFSTRDTDDGIEFEILSAARAGDPAFWALHVLGKVAQWVQADMWCRVLEAAAKHCDDTTSPPVEILTTRHRSAVP